jgi:hypothetical protein
MIIYNRTNRVTYRVTFTDWRLSISMKPLQLWIPAFNTYNLYDSQFRKDVERAMKQWRGEERIWLHPKFKKTTSGVRESINIVETAIPSKTFNLFYSLLQ